MAHAEQQELSAYLDGEIAAPERARLERHLRGCGECRAALRALEVTLSDVRALPDVELDPQASFAVRAAIRRESRGRSMYRWVPAAAAAAIAGIAVIAITLGGSEPAGFSGPTLDIAAPRLIMTGVNYDEKAAEARVLALAQGEGGAQTAGGGTSGSGARVEGDAAPQTLGEGPPPPADAVPRAGGADEQRPSKKALEKCVRAATGDEDVELAPMIFEWATFKGHPAFLLAFGVPADRPERVELWVMDSQTCAVLFFAQRRIA